MSATVEFTDPALVSLVEGFQSLYRSIPKVFRAPGRINLIGEHTDYNDGFVMPAAIDSYTWVAAAPRTDRVLAVRSEQFEEAIEFSLDELTAPPRKHWSDYVRGVAAMLAATGRVSGASLMITSNVPVGAGLSSSAALEVSTALALASLSELSLPGMQMAQLCQRAEHQYAGTQCGIMDQFISLFGEAGHALVLDCRSLDYTRLSLPNDVRIVICNTQVKHELATGEYNRRRADCEAGVAQLKQVAPGIGALRDVTPAFLNEHKTVLPDVVYRRCRHVVGENQRVLTAVGALRAGNMKLFGQLMYASHASLRDDYEVSCSELDLLVHIAAELPGVFGARMTGGGFGGCTVNIVQAEAVSNFRAKTAELYRAKTGVNPPIYVCSPAGGAAPIQV